MIVFEAITNRMQRCIGVVAILFLAIQVGKSEEDYDVCYHQECYYTARSFINEGNISVRPCDDFYEYMCGSFLSYFNLTADIHRYGITQMLNTLVQYRLQDLLEETVDYPDTVLEEKAKALYLACMDTEKADQRGTKFLEELMDNVDGCPIIEPRNTDDEENVNWNNTHNYFHKLTGTGSVINVRVYGNYLTNHTPTIHLDQPVSVFGRFGRIGKCHKPIYSEFLKDLAISLAVSSRNHVSIETVKQDVKDVMDFRNYLVKYMSWGSARRNASRMDNHATFEFWQTLSDEHAAKHNYSNIDWLQFVSDVFGNNIPLQSSQEIVVSEPNYLLRALYLIYHTPLRTIRNHICLNFIERHIKYTTSTMRTKLNVLHERLTGVSRTPQRWKVCLTENPMRHVVARMYVRTYFANNTKELVMPIAEDVRSALIDEVRNAPWMVNRTQRRTIRKLRKLKIQIGYPEFYDNDQEMEEYYQNQPAGPDNLLNALGYAQNEFRMQALGLLGRNKKEDQHYPTDVNAFYDFNRNLLQVHMAMLQWPYFTPNLPDVVVYATLGSIFGHEMGHAFDRIGRNFDENGTYKSWWNNETYQAYKKKIDCIIDQYDNYAMNTPEGVLHANGRKTVNEDVADAIGVRAALDAFKKKNEQPRRDPIRKLPGVTYFTTMQTFFYAKASVKCQKLDPHWIKKFIADNKHSLPKFRVNGPLSNLPEFSDAFGCDLGTPMNPYNQCQIWEEQ